MNQRGTYLNIFIKNLTECTPLVQDVDNEEVMRVWGRGCVENACMSHSSLL